ncbi:MAG: hypothetical protein NVS1B4_22330 [Gemmatimonadaceae bacterium]
MSTSDLPTAAQRIAQEDRERRSNLVLRALIDEMLERVREMNRNSTLWAGDSRARAEADLEAIMARVRRVAAQQRNS